MLYLNSFFLVIFLFKQIIFIHSASVKQEVPRNDVPQQQPSILVQNLPKEKLNILESDNTQELATQMQHDSKDSHDERADRNIDDLEVDVASDGQQSNDLNEMINQIKEVETFHEQLELNNDISSLGEGNSESGKSEENILVVTTSTTPISSNNDNLSELEDSEEVILKTTVKPSLNSHMTVDETEKKVIKSMPEAYNETIQNISLLKEDRIISKQGETVDMNILMEKINNNLPDKMINNLIPEQKAALKSSSNEMENNEGEDSIVRKNTLHSKKTELELNDHGRLNPHYAPKDEVAAPHVDQHPLKSTEKNDDGDKIKAEKIEEEKEEHEEELSLWERILLGLRCARQDCQGLF
uniref:Uncharacterized protein n=1 Tax=Meloidogyne hapla TaxID=6305 RepID=A0A1I8BCS2_MELHA